MKKEYTIHWRTKEKLRRAFDANAKVIALKQKADTLSNKGLFAQAMQVNKQIRDLWEITLNEYISSYTKAKESLTLASCGLDKFQQDKVNTILLSLFMCCDIIDTGIKDINDILHKKDGSLHFEEFSGIKDLADEVKRKIEFLYQETSYFKDTRMANANDNMYQMLLNKAKKLIREEEERSTPKN